MGKIKDIVNELKACNNDLQVLKDELLDACRSGYVEMIRLFPTIRIKVYISINGYSESIGEYKDPLVLYFDRKNIDIYCIKLPYDELIKAGATIRDSE